MTHSGKWSVAGVPHRGWICEGVEDLQSPSGICEMCETQTIRYVHRMRHRDYEGTLDVGCVCAGKMEEDSAAARSRERSKRNLSARRSKWLSRKWRRSSGGNPFLNIAGFNVVVFRQGSRWSGRVEHRETAEAKFLSGLYKTEDEAKLALFDILYEVKGAQ